MPRELGWSLLWGSSVTLLVLLLRWKVKSMKNLLMWCIRHSSQPFAFQTACTQVPHWLFLISAGQQKDLKWSLAGVQLFSGEGLDTCVRVLQKLCSVLLQPWRLHGHMGPTPQRCMILSICISTIRLLRTMLMELLSGGTFQLRDSRVANVLVTLHMIVCSIPATGRLDGEETRVQALIVDVMLTFTQGVNEKVWESLV